MLCPVCRGAGNIVTMARGLEYWPCGGCHGAGVLVLYAPAILSRRRGGRSEAPR